MSILFTGHTNIALWEGGTVGPGTVVQNSKTGDVGAVKWVTEYQTNMYGTPVPTAATRYHTQEPPPKFEDLVFKVDVWRLGEQRIWYGRDIRVLEDDSGGQDPLG